MPLSVRVRDEALSQAVDACMGSPVVVNVCAAGDELARRSENQRNGIARGLSIAWLVP
jgi:cobalamin biosynthesis protein CbiD